ncbi:MAG: hypothetical protein NVS2B16_23230 [Chloroflexota bacterium]
MTGAETAPVPEEAGEVVTDTGAWTVTGPPPVTGDAFTETLTLTGADMDPVAPVPAFTWAEVLVVLRPAFAVTVELDVADTGLVATVVWPVETIPSARTTVRDRAMARIIPVARATSRTIARMDMVALHFIRCSSRC